MTTNPKPNELPNDVEAMPELTRPLIVDIYLSKEEVIRRLCDGLGVDCPRVEDGGDIHMDTLAGIYCAANPACDRGPDDVTAEMNKEDVIANLGVLYDFPYRDDQSDLLKSQAVFAFVIHRTGDQPAPFELPTDPPIDLDGPDGGADGDLPDPLLSPQTARGD